MRAWLTASVNYVHITYSMGTSKNNLFNVRCGTINVQCTSMGTISLMIGLLPGVNWVTFLIT